MRVIVTTVGLSLYENYLKAKRDIAEHYEALREEPSSAYEGKKERISAMKGRLREFINKNPQDACAETKSVGKIQEILRDDISVRLLATDTVLSVVAAELLAEMGCGFGIQSDFNRELDTIKGLQVSDAKQFKGEGSKNLFLRLYDIGDERGGMIAINMTGGFKATIPLLTVFGQVNGVPLYYIFENTDALIEIPQAPMDIDWSVFEKHAGLLSKLEREEIAELPDKDLMKKHPELEPLLEALDDIVYLSALGLIMWRRYKSKREILYFSEHALSELEKLGKGKDNALAKACSELKAKLRTSRAEPNLRHPLKGCDLPDGFNCYKTMIGGEQARIIWSDNTWTTNYGSQELDLYIASFYMGQDVHNADTEYVKRLNMLIKSHYSKAFDKEEFKPVTFDKEKRNISREVEYV